MTKKVWLILLAVVFVFGFSLLGCSDGGGGGDDPVVVWQPNITGTTTINSDEYIGQTSIQAADKASTTLGVVAGGFTFVASTGSYKAINIQTGTAVAGTSYYTSEFPFNAVASKTYTISFMARVASGTGQIRFKPNSKTGSFDSGTAISTAATLLTCTWTQTADGGNFQFDSGSTATSNAITITGIKITTP
jgi:hypothetical protein